MIEILEVAENTAELTEPTPVNRGIRQIRNMEPGDLPRIWRAARAQNRRDGTNYPVPPIFDLDPDSPGYTKLFRNVVLALATVVDGRVRAGHVFLRTIEEMSFGGGREDMDFSMAHLPIAYEILKRKGYDDVHTFVPQPRLADLLKTLEREGMVRVDQRLAHFFRML
jgi:hypothetical protein